MSVTQLVARDQVLMNGIADSMEKPSVYSLQLPIMELLEVTVAVSLST